MSLVSIVVPTYNRLPLLRRAVQSVFEQSVSCWELVVVDDGSDDGTCLWIRDQLSNESRIHLIERSEFRPTCFGAQVCRNLGLQKAAGTSVLFLDSDDLLAPDCLLNRLAYLNADPSLDAVVGQALHFSEQPGDLGTDLIWGRWQPGQDDLDCFLSDAIPWQTSGPLWRRESLERVGPWDESLQHVGHDHEFHVRAVCRGLKIARVERVDYYWRVPREDSLSSFESFKTRHRDGGMIRAYQAILHQVVNSGFLTPLRRRLMVAESIRLAVRCRNFGGSASMAEQILLDACNAHLIDRGTTAVCRVLLRCWWRLGGILPSMALLNRLASRIS